MRRSVPTIVLVSVLASTIALAIPPAAAQDWGWEGRDATSDDFVQPRFFTALAPNAAGSQVVLFGGNPNGPSQPDPYADTWTIEGSSWTPRCGTSVPAADGDCGPVARYLHGMGTGPNGVIMFGGADSGGGALGDTWRWDGSSWAIVCDVSGCPPGNGDPQPSARALFAMAGNGTDVVLYGGIGTNLDSDTWVWDGSSWTEACNGCAPGPLGGAAMAWDGEKFVMFGGQADLNTDANADTWSFAPGETDWTQVCGDGMSVCGPPPRAQHLVGGSVTGNAATDGVVMVGGSPQPGVPDTALVDSWFFSRASDTWSALGDGPWINAEGSPCGGPAALTGGLAGGLVVGTALLDHENAAILGGFDLADAVATLCPLAPPGPDEPGGPGGPGDGPGGNDESGGTPGTAGDAGPGAGGTGGGTMLPATGAAPIELSLVAVSVAVLGGLVLAAVRLRRPPAAYAAIREGRAPRSARRRR